MFEKVNGPMTALAAIIMVFLTLGASFYGVLSQAAEIERELEHRIELNRTLIEEQEAINKQQDADIREMVTLLRVLEERTRWMEKYTDESP